VLSTNSGSTEVLRSSLSRHENLFKLQVGPGRDGNWTAVDIHAYERTDEGLIEAVHNTPSSLGYAAANQILGMNVGLVVITDAAQVTEPTSRSLSASMVDVGLAYGNDGRESSERTVDLTLSTALHSWPFSHLIYFVVDTENATDNCKNKTSQILNFFYGGGLHVSGSFIGEGLAFLPNEYSLLVLEDIFEQVSSVTT
jgi:ABC-type phosphate transport system substrate-binding protein